VFCPAAGAAELLSLWLGVADGVVGVVLLLFGAVVWAETQIALESRIPRALTLTFIGEASKTIIAIYKEV
jgi:hypothetical protein